MQFKRTPKHIKPLNLILFSLQKMAEDQTPQTLVYHGERTAWISPVNLNELLELKAKHPQAPLVVGNTAVGM